jgi:ElaB/YqjD/DUF883 family membrane-anchored ribosome-binding protein
MNTKQFEKQLKKEKAKLEQELHKVAMTLEALAVLTGKRVATAAGPLKKRAYKQSAKARKAIGAAKKAWWAARKKAAKA